MSFLFCFVWGFLVAEEGGGVFLFRFVLIKAVFKFTYYKSVSLIVND